MAGLSVDVWRQARGGRGGETVHDDPVDELDVTSMVREQPFRSDKPIVGPLIAWFRTVWNSASTRWYVLPMVEQQNAFNTAVVSHLREMSGRMIATDRDQTALARNIAELRYRLIGVNRRVAAMGAQAQPPETDLNQD